MTAHLDRAAPALRATGTSVDKLPLPTAGHRQPRVAHRPSDSAERPQRPDVPNYADIAGQSTVLLAQAEIVRSLGASGAPGLRDDRSNRVTANHFTKESAQMAQTSSQTVTVRTVNGQELSYPWATSVRVDRRGDLRVVQGFRQRAFHPCAEWLAYTVTNQRARAEVAQA